MKFEVVSLRRYPVKSMAGESLSAVELDARGLVGDRWYAVEDGQGRFATGKNSRRFRRRDRVFEYSATTTEHGVAVSGPTGRWQVGDEALDAELSRVMGAPVRVSPESTVPHQDMGSVSLIGTATLGWCASRWGLDADPRRLRVNVVITTSKPFVEETWQGRAVAIGTAELRVVQRVPRCRMIDINQDGAVARGRWLKPLTETRDMFLAMYADVATQGTIQVGDVLHPL